MDRFDWQTFYSKKMMAFLLQVGKLLEGEINREGILVLILFFIMGAIAVGFAFFVGYKAFKSK